MNRRGIRIPDERWADQCRILLRGPGSSTGLRFFVEKLNAETCPTDLRFETRDIRLRRSRKARRSAISTLGRVEAATDQSFGDRSKRALCRFPVQAPSSLVYTESSVDGSRKIAESSRKCLNQVRILCVLCVYPFRGCYFGSLELVRLNVDASVIRNLCC